MPFYWFSLANPAASYGECARWSIFKTSAYSMLLVGPIRCMWATELRWGTGQSFTVAPLKTVVLLAWELFLSRDNAVAP